LGLIPIFQTVSEAVFSEVGVFRSPHRSLIHVERIRLVT
jgi:hypothetical protein